jgi:hypothetical protein
MEQKLLSQSPSKKDIKSEPEKSVSIALVDDHILLRDALATVVNNFEDCKITLLVKPSRKIGQLSFIQFCKFKLFNYEKKKFHRKQNPFDHQAV